MKQSISDVHEYFSLFCTPLQLQFRFDYDAFVTCLLVDT